MFPYICNSIYTQLIITSSSLTYMFFEIILQVPGRLYPIELQYLPITEEDKSGKTQRLDPGPYIRVLQRIEHKVGKIHYRRSSTDLVHVHRSFCREFPLLFLP